MSARFSITPVCCAAVFAMAGFGLGAPSVVFADGLSAVPQINRGASSVYVPQLGRTPPPPVRVAQQRAQPVRRAPQQAAGTPVANSSIVDFAESTEALGFRLPSVRQGVRIVAR